MARRVSNTNSINAGTNTGGGSLTINRIRIKRQGAPAAAAAVLDLDSSVSVGSNQQFELASGALQLDFKSGDFGDGFMNDFVNLLFGNSTDGFTNIEVDFISGANSVTPIAASTGLTQQTWNNFTFSNPAD